MLILKTVIVSQNENIKCNSKYLPALNQFYEELKKKA